MSVLPVRRRSASFGNFVTALSGPLRRLSSANGSSLDSYIGTPKVQAIEVARMVLRYEQAGITITPSQTILLAREYLKALHIPETV